MELKTAKAIPINQEGRFLILLFGPDRDLKQIAQYVRARFAGHTINIRSTDNPVDAYAEFTPCERRIIVDTAHGRRVAALYDQAKLAYTLMRWDGSALFESSGDPVDETTSVQASFVRLSDGRVIDRTYGLERAARHMGMSVAALSSLDDATLSGAVEVALGKAEPPQAIKRRKRASAPEIATQATDEVS